MLLDRQQKPSYRCFKIVVHYSIGEEEDDDDGEQNVESLFL